MNKAFAWLSVFFGTQDYAFTGSFNTAKPITFSVCGFISILDCLFVLVNHFVFPFVTPIQQSPIPREPVARSLGQTQGHLDIRQNTRRILAEIPGLSTLIPMRSRGSYRFAFLPFGSALCGDCRAVRALYPS